MLSLVTLEDRYDLTWARLLCGVIGTNNKAKMEK